MKLPKNIVAVRRLPSAKNLYAHEMALAAGLFLVLISVFFDATIAGNLSFWQHLLLLVIFCCGTLLGGIFAWAVLFFVLLGYGGALPDGGRLWPALFDYAVWYLLGFISGYVLAQVYNYLVYFYLLYLSRNKPKISFVYNKKWAINIVKSPVPDEDTFVELEQEIKNERLHKFDLESVPTQPYTMLFIANPRLKNNGGYKIDPIVEDEKLFYRMVDQALKSFEDDELVGNFEILSRLRIITVFPPKDLIIENDDDSDLNLADGFEGTISISNVIINNILSPQEGMFGRVKNILHKLIEESENIPEKVKTLIREIIPDETEPQTKELKCGIDVIFALSASEKYTRSSAVFSDYPDTFDDGPKSNKDGESFFIDINPEKPGIQKVVYPKLYNQAELAMTTNAKKMLHEYYCKVPGRVAINVLSARQKTFIHEFTHAMSSAFNGAIADEYADNIHVQGKDHKNYVHHELFYINRRERQDPNPALGEYIPVPQRFMIFNSSQHYSDLTHPSAKENWRGYFPERIDPTIPCIMDRSAGHYRFDKLITAFMYDRLSAKFNRK